MKLKASKDFLPSQDTRQKLSKMFVGLGDVLGVLRAGVKVYPAPPFH